MRNGARGHLATLVVPQTIPDRHQLPQPEVADPALVRAVRNRSISAARAFPFHVSVAPVMLVIGYVLA